MTGFSGIRIVSPEFRVLQNSERLDMETWTKGELRLFGRLSSPIKIQRYLNRMAYDPNYGARSPRWIIKERKAHCFEGAIFAAAALRQLGHRPRLVDIRSSNEHDPVIPVFTDP